MVTEVDGEDGAVVEERAAGTNLREAPDVAGQQAPAVAGREEDA
jgi:hypothetical protein